MRPAQLNALVQRLMQWEAAGFLAETADFILTARWQANTMRLQFEGRTGGSIAAAVYSTRAALNASLASDVNALALVISADADLGIYAKAGAAGGGSWPKTGFTFSEATRAVLQALISSLGVPAAHTDFMKGQAILNGGGAITWGGPGGKLRWSGRFLMIPMSRATAGDSYFGIAPLADGGSIPAAQTNNGIARAYDSSGIVLNAYEALWAAFTPGGANGAYTLQLTIYPTTYTAPANWILIAAVNGDDGSAKLGIGQTIASGQSFSPGAGSFDTVTSKGAGTFAGPVKVGSYTVSTLPTAGAPGRVAYATNGRAFNGTGALEGGGAGTGTLVTDSGSAWRVAGTNQNVQS